MKVLLRNTQNGCYYQGPSVWTPEPEAARNLEQLSRAISVAFDAHLEDVEIVLSYEDPHFDLVLPVHRPPVSA